MVNMVFGVTLMRVLVRYFPHLVMINRQQQTLLCLHRDGIDFLLKCGEGRLSPVASFVDISVICLCLVTYDLDKLLVLAS